MGEDDCPALGCCMDDCCAPRTKWDPDTMYCVADPTSEGFDGSYVLGYQEGCIYRICCEETCCGDGTEYNGARECCAPHMLVEIASFDGGLHETSYESDLIQFPLGLPGKKSVVVEVSSQGGSQHVTDEKMESGRLDIVPSSVPAPSPRDPSPPTPLPPSPPVLDPLDQIKVTAELVIPGKDNVNIPVARRIVDKLAGGISSENVPDNSEGVLLKVTGPSSFDISFNTHVITAVEIVLDDLTDIVEEQSRLFPTAAPPNSSGPSVLSLVEDIKRNLMSAHQKL